MLPSSLNQPSRRTFLKQSAAPPIMPARVLGAEGGTSPNNRINVAMIGTGRQVFYANLILFLGLEEIQVVATSFPALRVRPPAFSSVFTPPAIF